MKAESTADNESRICVVKTSNHYEENLVNHTKSKKKVLRIWRSDNNNNRARAFRIGPGSDFSDRAGFVLGF